MGRVKEMRQASLVWGSLAAVFVAAIVIVNPQRELLTQDDGWAYARSVATLLNTGRYELDQWSAANMPVQIYFATGLAKLFGYSLSLLRWSTLLLLAVALASFHALLRQLGSRALEALALTLGLLASPIFLMLSFTFMSDVHFLGWLLLALYCYVRGLRQESAWSMLLGSLAAACAIGTRQFGIAVIGGCVAAWLFAGRDMRPPLRHMALALAAPLAMALWQFTNVFGEPNFTQSYRLTEQKMFFSHSIPALVREMAWRCAISAQYLAIFLLPILPLIAGAGWQAFRSRPGARRVGTILSLLVLLLLAGGLRLNSPLTVRPPITGGPGWPALGIIWVFPTVLWAHPEVQRGLDLLGFVAVLPLAWFVLSAGRPVASIRSISPEALLLGGTGLALFGLQLAYVQFNDTYIVGFLPFVLLLIRWRLRQIDMPRFWLIASIVLSCIAITITTLWMRHDYDRQQRDWDAADKVVAGGVPYDRTIGPKHWAEYRGAFDEWIRAGAPGIVPPPAELRIGQDPFHDPFYKWLDARNRAIWREQAAQ